MAEVSFNILLQLSKEPSAYLYPISATDYKITQTASLQIFT